MDQEFLKIQRAIQQINKNLVIINHDLLEHSDVGVISQLILQIKIYGAKLLELYKTLDEICPTDRHERDSFQSQENMINKEIQKESEKKISSQLPTEKNQMDNSLSSKFSFNQLANEILKQKLEIEDVKYAYQTAQNENEILQQRLNQSIMAQEQLELEYKRILHGKQERENELETLLSKAQGNGCVNEISKEQQEQGIKDVFKKIEKLKLVYRTKIQYSEELYKQIQKSSKKKDQEIENLKQTVEGLQELVRVHEQSQSTANNSFQRFQIQLK